MAGPPTAPARSPLAAVPTLVLGLGAPLAPLLGGLAQLLSAYEERLLPVVRVAAVEEGELSLFERDERRPAGEPLEEALAACLEAILTERNLEQVRGSGVQVGIPGGLLVARVLLVLDGSAGEEVPAALKALTAAAERLHRPVPFRLTALVLATGRERSELGFPLERCLAEARSAVLEPLNVVLLDRFRADGSSLGGETREGMREIRHILSFLLFASLLPTRAGEHWLFLAPGHAAERLPYHTLGGGLLAVPLGEVEGALTHQLVHDLLALLEEPPEVAAAPERFLPRFSLEQTFAEQAAWQALFAGLPVTLSPVDAGDEPFSLELAKGEVRLDLSGRHWREWGERIANYDAVWGAVRLRRWVDRLREQARARSEELDAALAAPLDAAVREGRGALPLAEAALGRARHVLEEEWRCDLPNVRTGVPKLDLVETRMELFRALKEMPSAWALGARCLLLTTLFGHVAFAAARATTETAWIAGIAGAGLAVAALTLWLAARSWHRGRERVYRARDAYLDAIAGRYEGVLRSEGILVLRELRKRLLERVEAAEAELERLRERRRQVAARAAETARRFAPERSVLVRPVIDRWDDLQGVAADLWGGRDLKPLLQALLQRLPAVTFAELAQRAAPVATGVTEGDAARGGAAGDPLLRACLAGGRALLREELSGPRLRRLAYYLERRFPERAARETWLREEVRALHRQGATLLWPKVRGQRRLWQLLPGEDAELAEAARAGHPEAADTLSVPGILGTLGRQEVPLPEES